MSSKQSTSKFTKSKVKETSSAANETKAQVSKLSSPGKSHSDPHQSCQEADKQSDIRTELKIGEQGNNIAAKGSESVLRDDEECFLADFTRGTDSSTEKKCKFELFEPFKRGRIAGDIVDMDPDVTLRIRAAPGLDAAEVGTIQVGDCFDIAGCCGHWLRLCGNEEKWVLEKTDDLVLVEILPQSGWGMSWGRSLLNSWASSGKREEDNSEPGNNKSPGGWSLGLLSKTVTDYVPASVTAISHSALEISTAVATNAVSKILAVGVDSKEDRSDSDGHGIRTEASVCLEKEGTISESVVDSSEVKEEMEEEMNGVEIEEGGLAPVRIVSQGITYIEGTIGWLGGVAGGVKAAALDTSTHLISDDIVDKAWEGVKGTAKASKTVVVGSTDAICHVTELGRAALANVAEAVLPVTPSSKDRFPNHSLGGVLAIELCGAIVQRDPLADEDEDPFVSDDYTNTPPVAASLSSIRRLVDERFQFQVRRMDSFHRFACERIYELTLRWAQVKCCI